MKSVSLMILVLVFAVVISGCTATPPTYSPNPSEQDSGTTSSAFRNVSELLPTLADMQGLGFAAMDSGTTTFSTSATRSFYFDDNISARGTDDAKHVSVYIEEFSSATAAKKQYDDAMETTRNMNGTNWGMNITEIIGQSIGDYYNYLKYDYYFDSQRLDAYRLQLIRGDIEVTVFMKNMQVSTPTQDLFKIAELVEGRV